MTLSCDSCPAVARVTWLELGVDLELRLCVHHSHKHAAGLLAAGFRPVPDSGSGFGEYGEVRR